MYRGAERVKLFIARKLYTNTPLHPHLVVLAAVDPLQLNLCVYHLYTPGLWPAEIHPTKKLIQKWPKLSPYWEFTYPSEKFSTTLVINDENPATHPQWEFDIKTTDFNCST